MHIMATTNINVDRYKTVNFTEKTLPAHKKCIALESQSHRIRNTFEKTIKQILLVLESRRFAKIEFRHLLLPEQYKYLWIESTERYNRLEKPQYCYQNKTSTHSHDIVSLLIGLNLIMDRRLTTDVWTNITHKDLLYASWIKDDVNRTKIKAIHQKLTANKQQSFDMERNVRNVEDIYTIQLQRIIEDNTNSISLLISNSNEAMVELCEIGKCRYDAEIDSVKNAQEMLDTLIQNDNFEENEAIQEKIKLQKQLKQLVSLYDQSIGERSLRLYESEKLFKFESQILIETKEKFESLGDVYNDIQTKKEAIEKKHREARLLLYMMNHAARTIQRFYRSMLANRKQKKKKGKKSGKGKAK